jgi:K+-transporting ATPase ATPase C chain
MLRELKAGIAFAMLSMALLGGVYPGVLWTIGRVAFPSQAEGSLVRDRTGRIVGSRVIAQAFTAPYYFHPRPSAVNYNAASSGGSNLGPSNPEYLETIRKRVSLRTSMDRVEPSAVPSEMVTASGAGLDPHISPEAAVLQAPRVASARRTSIERVRELVRSHTEPRALGLFGQSRINVLELNLALDEALGPPASHWRAH